MQLRLALAVALLALWPAAAAADCLVVVNTAGVLTVAQGGAQITSETGVPAVLAISGLSSLFGTTIKISNPRLDSWPAGFNASSVTVSDSYSALWLLGSAANASFTSADQSFSVPAITNVVVTLTLNNRATASNGFAQGNYTTKTTISCS